MLEDTMRRFKDRLLNPLSFSWGAHRPTRLR